MLHTWTSMSLRLSACCTSCSPVCNIYSALKSKAGVDTWSTWSVHGLNSEINQASKALYSPGVHRFRQPACVHAVRLGVLKTWLARCSTAAATAPSMYAIISTQTAAACAQLGHNTHVRVEHRDLCDSKVAQHGLTVTHHQAEDGPDYQSVLRSDMAGAALWQRHFCPCMLCRMQLSVACTVSRLNRTLRRHTGFKNCGRAT